MSRTYLDRRQVLKGLGVGALAAGATAALSPMTALADDDHKGPIGAWNINIHEEGQPSRQAVAGLAAGGVFTTVDSLGPGAVGLGAWNKEEDKHFAFKFTVYDFTHGGGAGRCRGEWYGDRKFDSGQRYGQGVWHYSRHRNF
jgi:hypothetical protein